MIPTDTKNDTLQALLARRILHNGWHISIPGPVSYPANSALREAVALIPEDRLLLETDAPYLAPVPYRGKRNEPAYIAQTADFIAAELHRDRAEIEAETYANACRLFGLSEQ